MKKLLLLTLACAYGTSMHAMELTDSGEDVMISMKYPIPVATKSNKQVRTRKLLERRRDELNRSLKEKNAEYEKINKQSIDAARIAFNNSTQDGAQARTDSYNYQKQYINLHEELKQLEEQIQTTKYEWFMNRIKHSKPTELQDALPYVIGQYKLDHGRWYFKYCLFTFEQKRKLLAYAQAIQANRNAEIHFSKGSEKFEGKKPDPRILRKYNDACDVTLIMGDFRNMSVKDQQLGSAYFEHQASL